jgi:hypothetical protein
MNKKYIYKTYANWSQIYYGNNLGFSQEQHQANNEWFETQMNMSKKGVCVPELGLCWDKETFEETKMEKYDFVFATLVSSKVFGGE